MSDDRMFSFYWFLTFLFWVFSGIIAVCGEIAVGIIMMFAGPPVSFIITTVLFSAFSLFRRKPADKAVPIRRHAVKKNVSDRKKAVKKKAVKKNASSVLPETDDDDPDWVQMIDDDNEPVGW